MSGLFSNYYEMAAKKFNDKGWIRHSIALPDLHPDLMLSKKLHLNVSPITGKELQDKLTSAWYPFMDPPITHPPTPPRLPTIDPNWINSMIVIALVNNFFYPGSKFLTTHLHHHYCQNPLCDRLGNVHHRDVHCTSNTFGRRC